MPTRKLPLRRDTEWSSEPLLMSPPETLHTPISSGADPPILATIYTTSPYAEVEKIRKESRPRNQTHHEDLAVIESILHSSGGQDLDEDVSISAEHTAQLIMIFREKMIQTISILDPNDFMDVDRLMTHHPDLVTCICYATTRYISGYQGYRERTKAYITDFLQASFDHQHQTDAEQIRTMESLMILYAFAPSTISTPSFAFVRAACEAYATKIALHRSVDAVKQLVASGIELSRNDLKVKRYLYWIWLYVISHHRSLVRRIPPTIPTDDSIQNAPILLESLGQDKFVGRLLCELHSRLIWDDIGRKGGKALTEWWAERHGVVNPNEVSVVAMEDIDAAVAYRRDQLRALRPRKLGFTPEGISTEYHFRLAHFCLSTHLILRVTAHNIDPSALYTVRRCVDLAMDVLNLSHNIGPLGKEAFRFQPGFVCVSISFCIAFVLQAIQAFPDHFPNTQFIFMVIKRIGSMMTDTAVDQTHDCGAAARANIRKLRSTIEALRNRRLREQERLASQSRRPSMAPSNATEHAPIPMPSASMPPSGPDVQESHRQETHDPTHSMAQQQVPWIATTESFHTDDMGHFGGFDYEELILDPAFNFPDFFNYAPQISS
ncbi:hypothetical protein BLS_000659 [Venturia inaequalis]|uniref:Transcription factor domain-containing protein n=1 Tax=Venturia inaequalis TaxID=5025 RepID=A0A8H3YL21_VENIN|nr:hypothetical protein BLS_000659 [Venturia inaequalis]